MFIKIYFDNKPVFLVEASDTILNNISPSDIIEFSPSNPDPFQRILTRINESQDALYIRTSDVNSLKSYFFGNFQVILAGGGVVKNKSNQILMIFRRGKWDLPKGKLDDGESISECALREVGEETGLKEIVLMNKLITTYHTYIEAGNSILKESHWYNMSFTGNEQLKPQLEEQITDIEWADTKMMDKYLSNTYPIIKEILDMSV